MQTAVNQASLQDSSSLPHCSLPWRRGAAVVVALPIVATCRAQFQTDHESPPADSGGAVDAHLSLWFSILSIICFSLL